MRERIFRRLLGFAERREPVIFRRFELLVLTRLAKRSFVLRAEAPRARLSGELRAASAKDPLQSYALLTMSCMEEGEADPERLYEKEYELGSRLRRITGFRNRSELERLVFYLYRNIDIDMSGSINDGLEISRCYFSDHYTPEQCALMSNVDSGIIAGICGGGRLIFTERITEGCGRCRACLTGGTENEQYGR